MYGMVWVYYGVVDGRAFKCAFDTHIRHQQTKKIVIYLQTSQAWNLFKQLCVEHLAPIGLEVVYDWIRSLVHHHHPFRAI